MAVGLHQPDQLLAVPGIKLAAGHCGIKKDKNIDDLVLIELEGGSSVSAVFTTNKFCAAPVTVARQHLHGQHTPRYLLINSGNANAGTGLAGEENALKSCQAVADIGKVNVEAVLPFSTGVIGEPLAVDKIAQALPQMFDHLDENNWLAAAKGIMTTDTLPKAVSRRVDINGQPVTITGISKGSGMIKPEMATMLAYIATDAVIADELLSSLLKRAVDLSFNAITVDGDTSTNDACVLMASGKSGVQIDSQNHEFIQALNEVFTLLAQAIIRDGEGATKFVEVKIEHAASMKDANNLAYTIAHSPLVKTALFASDANWGRILAAIGRAPLEQLDIDSVDLYLGDVCLIENGLPHPDYNEQRGQTEMRKQDITIRVNLHLGEFSTTVWTTDLSYDYIKINAEYRS